MHRPYLLMATAFVEVGTGLLLLASPSFPLEILLGLDNAAAETLFTGRIGGAALLAIGVASWLARNDTGSPAQHGLLIGVAVYDVGAASLLAYAGMVLRMAGMALWPAVVLHTALAVWCIVCFRLKPRDK
jgi:hypothetical protein